MLPQSRLNDIFPQGLDKKDRSLGSAGAHYTLKPEQLYYSLIERYDPDTHVESIIVRTITYGKHTRSAAQDFLLVQIEDTAVEGLTNYLILHRTTKEGAPGPLANSRASFTATSAVDLFRVSYEGDLEKLLRECQLRPYKSLQALQFPQNAPLYLYELVTLADYISSYYPNSHTTAGSCSYTAYIWTCLQKMRPSTNYQNDSTTRIGNVDWACQAPDAVGVTEAVKTIGDKLMELKVNLERQRIRWMKIRKALPREGTSGGIDAET